MLTNELRIARVQRTIQRFEEDIPLLNMRVKDLSKERQESTRKFAAAMMDQTRTELEKLLIQRAVELETTDFNEPVCEPAD